MYHPNELDQQIENLRTLQQSYDAVAGAAEAYNVGKTQLAAAITSKGVETSPTESYPEMAEKVNAISQEAYEINGGEMYAKQLFGSLETPNYWNLYDILAQLLSDGRLVQYGGILLAEYYKGYDSLALAEAGAGGAYVVSDKDENGQFKMYTEDTTHTWATEDDGKGNRWVAYCFADEYHNFQITDTNTSPRSIFIGRKVGTITSLVNGRISQIVCPDGNEYTKFNPGTYTQNWDKRVVLRGIKNQSGYLIYNAGNIESMYIEGDNITGNLFYDYWPSLVSLVIKCNTINEIIFTPKGQSYLPLNYIHIDNADGRLSLSEGSFTFSNSKKVFIITNTESFELFSNQVTNAANMSNSRVYFGYRTNDITKTVKINNGNPAWNELPDVELKAGWCKPLDIGSCIGLTEANMYAHILQRLKQDESDCGDGVTIILGSTNLAKLTSEESVQLLDDLTNIYGYTFA